MVGNALDGENRVDGWIGFGVVAIKGLVGRWVGGSGMVEIGWVGIDFVFMCCNPSSSSLDSSDCPALGGWGGRLRRARRKFIGVGGRRISQYWDVVLLIWFVGL